MQTNPFKPPVSKVADPLPSIGNQAPNKALVPSLLALFVIHIALFANYFGIYAELVRTGTLPALGPLIGLLADLVLLIGIVLLLVKRYTKFTFIVSGVGFLLASKLAWSIPFDRTLILVTYVLGAAVAFFGWWVVFHHSRRRGI